MKAVLKNYRQAPRKVRLVADSIKGKSVVQAQTELDYLVKRASLPMKKLLESAVANAVTHTGAEKDALFVKEVRVDKGVVIKRFMPRAFGRASKIHKHSSHVTLVLAERDMAAKTKKTATTKKAVVSKKTNTKKSTKTAK
jgi:large subunit ribosomal protein L22